MPRCQLGASESHFECKRRSSDYLRQLQLLIWTRKSRKHAFYRCHCVSRVPLIYWWHRIIADLKSVQRIVLISHFAEIPNYISSVVRSFFAILHPRSGQCFALLKKTNGMRSMAEHEMGNRSANARREKWVAKSWKQNNKYEHMNRMPGT